jgi:hypothetical protein
VPLSRIQQGGNSDPLIINNVVTSGLVVNGNTTVSGLTTTSSGIIKGNLTVSGNLAVGNISTSGVLTSNVPSYSWPNDIGTGSWWNIGTWYAPQLGYTLKLQLEHHGGYNASYGQNQETHIFFKTSNAGSVDVNGFAGDGNWWWIGGSVPSSPANGAPAIAAASGIVVVSNVGGINATSYTFYAYMTAYQFNSVQTVVAASGTSWVNNNIPNSTPPSFTGNSSTAVLNINNSMLQVGQLLNPALQGAIEKFGVFSSALSASNPATMSANNGTLYMATAATPTATWTANLQNCPTVAGQSITFAITVLNGSTAYLPSNITINGVQAGASSSALPAHKAVNNNITTYYQGGTAWSAADTSELDVYTFTAMCTASGVYTLLLGLNKF